MFKKLITKQFFKAVGLINVGYFGSKFVNNDFTMKNEKQFLNTLKIRYDCNNINNIKDPTVNQQIIALNKMDSFVADSYLENKKYIPEELYIKMSENEHTKETLKSHLRRNYGVLVMSNYLKWELLKNDPRLIEYITNQTEEMALYAIEYDPRLLLHIENKTEEVFLKFIDRFGNKEFLEDDSTVTTLDNFSCYFTIWTPKIIKELQNYGYMVENGKIKHC